MPLQRFSDPPGSPAWHARRRRCYNAGDASAVLGCHPSGKTRSEVLHALHTGIEREFSDYVQERVIDPGHRVEALWRPIGEEIIGDDLQVLGGELPVPGLSRPVGASLDGITMLEDTAGECKSMNDALRAALPHEGRGSHALNDARALPKGYRVQCEQQQMVFGTVKRTLFSACRFHADGTVAEERHAWYTPDPELRAEILAGWKQLDDERVTYVPPTAAAPTPVAEPVEALPVVAVQVAGVVTITENFDKFETAFRAFLATKFIREPKTDQHFADLEVQIKAMLEAEERLDAAEANWIAQIEPVSTAKRRKDLLVALVRENRLLAQKLLTSEKERRRGEIVAGGVAKLLQHVQALNARIGRPYMPESTKSADFGAAIKSKRSLSSMEEAVAQTLANAKVEANRIADRVITNLCVIDAQSDLPGLFPDAAVLALKDPEACEAIVKQRVADHQARAQQQAAELAEKERARIRAEEEARARALAAREQQEREAAERRQREEAAAAERQRQAEAHAAATASRREEANRASQDAFAGIAAGKESGALSPQLADDLADVTSALTADLAIHRAAGPGASVLPIRPTPAPSGPPTLPLGKLCERLGATLTAQQLQKLGFQGTRERGAVLFHEAQFVPIAEALIAQFQRACAQYRMAA